MSIQESLRQRLQAAIKTLFDIDLTDVPVEILLEPTSETSPFQSRSISPNASRLLPDKKQNPRGDLHSTRRRTAKYQRRHSLRHIAGAGYINVYFDPERVLTQLGADPGHSSPCSAAKSSSNILR
jgi:arginyl-tRNA synthetase